MIFSYIKSNIENLKKDWFEWLIKDYPETTKEYLRKTSQKFTNPVGNTLFENIGIVLTSFLENDGESSSFFKALEEILKIRITQPESDWEDVNIFVFLWNSIKPLLAESGKDEVISFVERYNTFTSKAIDKYIEIRETIFELQKNEIRRKYGEILDRINNRYNTNLVENNKE